MLLVILGAGASYDSSPLSPKPAVDPPLAEVDEDARPPLTTDLFDIHRSQYKHLERFPAAAPVVLHIRERLAAGANLEQVLDTLQQQEERYPQRRMQLMAVRFYLRQYLLDCSTNWWSLHASVITYASLVDQINEYSTRNRCPVTYVTFNYDTLLDRTLEAQGLRNLRDIDGYVAADGPLYIKVHGSVNWFRRVNAPFPMPHTFGIGEVIRHPPPDESLTENDGYVVNFEDSPTCLWNPPRSEPPVYGQADRPLMEVPAIAIPVERKTSRNFEMPASHRQALSDALANVDRILVIGWRGSEDHFNQLLLDRLPGLGVPVTLVCSDRGGETEVNLRRWGFGRIANTTLGFSDFALQGHLRDYLRQA
jgi:hypothetical protein